MPENPLPIPLEIEGFPTDVEEGNPGRASAGQRDERQYDPLIGGVASSNAAGVLLDQQAAPARGC